MSTQSQQKLYKVLFNEHSCSKEVLQEGETDNFVISWPITEREAMKWEMLNGDSIIFGWSCTNYKSPNKHKSNSMSSKLHEMTKNIHLYINENKPNLKDPPLNKQNNKLILVKDFRYEPCDRCGNAFTTWDTFKTHIRYGHNTILQWPQCPQVTTQTDVMSIHLSRKTSRTEKNINQIV